MFDGQKYTCDHTFYPRVKNHPTKIIEKRCGKKAHFKMWTGWNFLHFCKNCAGKTTSKPTSGHKIEPIS